ncbi:hypothetical protein [Cetacean poxvirus 1]|nr:hypothetical protein [Cetacean poxvirus 1]
MFVEDSTIIIHENDFPSNIINKQHKTVTQRTCKSSFLYGEDFASRCKKTSSILLYNPSLINLLTTSVYIRSNKLDNNIYLLFYKQKIHPPFYLVNNDN